MPRRGGGSLSSLHPEKLIICSVVLYISPLLQTQAFLGGRPLASSAEIFLGAKFQINNLVAISFLQFIFS